MNIIDEIKADTTECVNDARRAMMRVAKLATPKNGDKPSKELTEAIIILGMHVGQLAGLANFVTDKLTELLADKRDE